MDPEANELNPSRSPSPEPGAELKANPGHAPKGSRSSAAGPRVVVSANTAWYAYSFQGAVLQMLLSQGYGVTVVAPADPFASKIRALGCDFVPLKLNNKSTNPVTELAALWRFYRTYRRLQPDAILHYTPKPNIYGSLCARALGIPSISNIAGLGNAFVPSGLLSRLLTRIVKLLYRASQRSAARVFFQNRDDMQLFIEAGICRPAQAELLPGSGIDLERFTPQASGADCPDADEPTPAAGGDGRVRFVLIARLLWDKGVGEFAKAARAVRARYRQAEFQLVGFVDGNNPRAVPEEAIRGWESEGVLEWVGRQDDVRPFIAAADCVVLPSYYREGTPRSLLEAAASARPVIAADSIGCREPVDHGVTGLLCRPRDAADLARAMEAMIAIGAAKRAEMGRAGRAKMEREYDVRIITAAYRALVAELTAGASPGGPPPADGPPR